MFFIEDMVVLDDIQKQFVGEVTCNKGSRFPYFLSVTTPNRQGFIHGLMERNQNKLGDPGRLMSDAYEFFHNIFITFCEDHNIKVKKTLRAAINYSIYYPGLVCEPHVDHNFEHCNFLMYLTDCKGGNTIVYDENNNIIKSIPPEKFKAVIFPGLTHAIEEFEPGEDRIVLVFTFVKE